MITKQIYENEGRRWVFLGRDPERKAQLIDTNTYLVTHHDEGLLLDPGGLETFPQVVTAVSQEIPVEQIRALFASHQDPDIISSLSLWMELIDDLELYAS